MSVDGAGIQRAVEGAHAWSGFLMVVCIFALLNMALWTSHPALAEFSGFAWLGTEVFTARVLFVVFLLFSSVVTFSVSGLVDTLATAVRR